MTTPKFYFQNLDALRTIAALAVFLRHSPINGYMYSIPGVSVIWGGISSGDLGVTLFFTLSGFLITYLILLEESKKMKINVKNFYVRRVLRIWPLYYLVVLLGLFIVPIIIHKDPDIFSQLFYLTFLSNIEHIYADHLNLKTPMYLAITWSVSIEEQFYLFWPLLFLVFKNERRLIVLLILLAVSLIFRAVGYAFVSWPFVYYHTISNVYYLALGGIFAFLVFNQKQFKANIEGIKKPFLYLLYSVTLIIIFGRFLVWNSFLLRELSYLLVSLCFILIILEQCFAKQPLLSFGKLKTLSFFGRYTYGLYMLHPLGLKATEIIFAKFGFRYGVDYILVQGLTAFVISVIMALASYHLFEIRFLKLKERF